MGAGVGCTAGMGSGGRARATGAAAPQATEPRATSATNERRTARWYITLPGRYWLVETSESGGVQM